MQVSDATLSQFSPSDLSTASSSVVQEFLTQLLTKVATHNHNSMVMRFVTSLISIEFQDNNIIIGLKFHLICCLGVSINGGDSCHGQCLPSIKE